MHASIDVGRIAERRARRSTAFLGMLGGVLAAAFLLAVGQGAVAIHPGQAVAILSSRVGIELPWPYDRTQEAVLLAIRLPRAALAMLVGAALAASGASLQGLFRNPLADPALVGVSTGAALAAAATIVVGGSLLASLPPPVVHGALPASAFLGGLASTFVVYRLASRDGRTEVATMLLAGVALNAVAGAAIGLFVFVSTDQELRDLNFWLLGSLGGIGWERLAVALPLIALPTVLLATLAGPLNAMLMGETEALHLGVEVERAKRRIVVLTALAVGASVALTGVIGFVGLVVPHIVRLAIGPDHRALLPASLLLGAALLLVADLLARTVALPAELPIGIVTSAVGGPFFLWLLVRRRAQAMW